MQPLKPVRRDTTDTPPQWYALSDTLELSLRLVNGATFGESDDGELVLEVADAVHAARFEIDGQQLWLHPLAGLVTIDNRAVSEPERLQPGNQLVIGTIGLHVSQVFCDLIPARQEEANPSDAPTDVRVTDLDADEITRITRRDVANFNAERTITLVDDATRVIRAPEPKSVTHEQEISVTFRVPAWLRWTRSSRTAWVAGICVTVSAGLLVAIGYVANQKLAAPQVVETAAEPQASVSPVVAVPPVQSEPIAVPPPTPEPNVALLGPSIDEQMGELVAIVKAGDLTAENNHRVLTLAVDLQASQYSPVVMTYLRLWQSRLMETTDLLLLEEMNGTFRAIGAIGELRGSLEERTQNLAKLKLLNKRASELFVAGELHTPGKVSVVSIAGEMLALEPANPDGLAWLRRAADVLVLEARNVLATGDRFEARNLIEDVLGFHPTHADALELWSALGERRFPDATSERPSGKPAPRVNDWHPDDIPATSQRAPLDSERLRQASDSGSVASLAAIDTPHVALTDALAWGWVTAEDGSRL